MRQTCSVGMLTSDLWRYINLKFYSQFFLQIKKEHFQIKTNQRPDMAGWLEPLFRYKTRFSINIFLVFAITRWNDVWCILICFIYIPTLPVFNTIIVNLYLFSFYSVVTDFNGINLFLVFESMSMAVSTPKLFHFILLLNRNIFYK